MWPLIQSVGTCSTVLVNVLPAQQLVRLGGVQDRLLPDIRITMLDTNRTQQSARMGPGIELTVRVVKGLRWDKISLIAMVPDVRPPYAIRTM